MTQLYEIKVSLSPNQKKNLSNAYHKRETIVLRLTKDSLSGNDTLYVPSNVVKRLAKSQKLKKGWILNWLRLISGNKLEVLF